MKNLFKDFSPLQRIVMAFLTAGIIYWVLTLWFPNYFHIAPKQFRFTPEELSRINFTQNIERLRASKSGMLISLPVSEVVLITSCNTNTDMISVWNPRWSGTYPITQFATNEIQDIDKYNGIDFPHYCKWLFQDICSVTNLAKVP